jgi:hypothetical protein
MFMKVNIIYNPMRDEWGVYCGYNLLFSGGNYETVVAWCEEFGYNYVLTI